MAERRDRVWAQLLAQRTLPAWLEEWVEHCCDDSDPLAAPEYDYLHSLIPRPRTAAPAAALKAEPSSAALLRAEE